MKTKYTEGSRISLAWIFVLVIIEIVLIWAVGSQFSWTAKQKGNLTSFHVFLIFGVILIGMASAITIGMAGARATERWADQRCRNFFGADFRLLYKSEVFVLFAVVFGTLIGTGVWDVITILNALVESGWDLSVFLDSYLVIDLVFFQITWQLWLHLVVGATKGGIALVLAIIVAGKIRKGTFCEV